MKIKSLLLLLLFLSTHTVYANENAYTEVPSEACNSTYNLPNNQWRQVSLPCTPEGDGSVSEVFGDDIAEIFVAGTPSYDTDWVVYKYDPSIDGGYTKLTESDTLSVGVGYWIIQQSGGDATLDLPLNSIHAPAIQSDVCSSSNGCFEIQLKANTDAVRWNMIGRPFGFISRLGGMQVQANIEACAAGCDLSKAESVKLVNNKLWTYDGLSNYISVNNPDGTLDPWVGYWAVTWPSKWQGADGITSKFLIPKVDPIQPGEQITREQLKRMIKNGEAVSQVNTSQITDMSHLFFDVLSFSQDIGSWDVSQVTNMSDMFYGVSFNQDISHWDVGNVVNMGWMFFGSSFNQDVSRWNVRNVANMEGVFSYAESFNQDIGSWSVSNVIDMGSMFANAKSFNQDISGWDVGNVNNMRAMFSGANSFNQDINSWDVSSVSDMEWMFAYARSFNQNISSWNVSNISNMIAMFYNASSFNQDIDSWDVSDVTGMYKMFSGASSFNQNISSWNVGNVTGMYEMFSGASSFNQDVSRWDVGNVTDMVRMFGSATSFVNQDLSEWNVSNVTSHDDFLKDAGPGNIEPNWP